jgi:hypothetical protein
MLFEKADAGVAGGEMVGYIIWSDSAYYNLVAQTTGANFVFRGRCLRSKKEELEVVYVPPCGFEKVEYFSQIVPTSEATE